MRWLIASMMGLVIGCAGRDGGAGSSADGSGDGSADDGSADGSGDGTSADAGTSAGDASATAGDEAMTEGSTATTGDGSACDPSDPDIGPAVAVTIVNQTDAPLFFTESSACAFGSPFGIAKGSEAIAWIIGICSSCADALQGLCFCPAACAQDTVIRVDAGGRYEGSWPGSVIFDATLTPDCVDETCGDQCQALAQADAGDYVANAIASPMVDCGPDTCDCTDAPDPDGWCSIAGTRTGGDIAMEAPFSYPSETAVELVFE